MARGAAAGDWLDAHCWRCGSEEALPDGAGRLLCGPCRADVFGPEGPAADALRVSARAYWESHALERCWRCLNEAVDPHDDVGLCRRCRADLERASAPTTSDRGPRTPAFDG